MSALEVLNRARAVGVDIGIDGDDLVLEAACQPPDEIIEALSSHKAEIAALLRPSSDGWKAEDWQAYYDKHAGIAEFDAGTSRRDAEARAFECCVVEWMNRHPEPSDPGHCAWCKRQDQSGHIVVRSALMVAVTLGFIPSAGRSGTRTGGNGRRQHLCGDGYHFGRGWGKSTLLP